MVLFSVVSLLYLIKTERGSIFKRVLNYYYHNLALRYMQYMGLLLFCLFVCFLGFSFNSLSNNCGFFLPFIGLEERDCFFLNMFRL